MIAVTSFGISDSRNRKPLDIAKKAITPPSPNSGIAEPPKKYVQRRSRECRPGATNAQNWYSHSGLEMIKPITIASFRWMKSGSNRPVTYRWQAWFLTVIPPLSLGGRLQNGLMITVQL